MVSTVGDSLFERYAAVDDQILERELGRAPAPYPPDPWEVEEIMALEYDGIPSCTSLLPLWSLRRVGKLGIGLWIVLVTPLWHGTRCILWGYDYLPPGWERNASR